MPAVDVFAALRWWIVLLVLGLVAMPLAWQLLRWLPDRGYAFVKMLGVLLVSYCFWLLSSLGLLANDLGGIVVSLLLALTPSLWIYRRHRAELGQWVHVNRRYLLAAELVFAVIFFFWAWVRAQNPAITGTEKPMEFAFLNAVGRSPTMPPLDPWMSGFAISYYYFGYVMTSVLARLAAVAEPSAFNLGIAWLTAGTALGAFGLVYNLVAAGKQGSARRGALTLGLIAALALPLAGNMQILLEMLHANGVGSEAFWAWLDVRDVNGPPSNDGFGPTGPRFWWWWRSSRVIHEYHLSGRAEEGLEPIAEFPGFSFVLGDMHPHVLALPFAFLSLAIALTWWMRSHAAYVDEKSWQTQSFLSRFGLLVGRIGLPLWLLTAVVLGGLSFLNTWDVLIHLFVVVAAFTLNQWRIAGRWQWRFVSQAIYLALLLILPAVLLYLPFYVGFKSQAGPPYLLPMLMKPTRLAQYLIIFGMPMWVLLIMIGTLVMSRRRHSWQIALATSVVLVGVLFIAMILLGWLIAASPEGSARIAGLADELGIVLPSVGNNTLPARTVWGLRSVFAIMPVVLAARVASPWLTLLLASLVGLIIMLWSGRFRQRSTSETVQREDVTVLPFVLLLVLTGALLTLGPEFLYLRDNFGQRLNTVFKFYYQSWVLFGVAALFALDFLWRTARASAVLASVGYGAMFAVALLFPAYSITSRAAEYSHPPTLNGIAHYRYNQPDEYAALTWLRENVQGAPVVVEAIGGQYSPQGHGRISATTGLPTPLGWAGHEYQWRGQTPEPPEREKAVQQIYTNPDWEATSEALNRYGVRYIYVGPLELSTYGAQVTEKFNGRLQVAYANGSVIIYRWAPF